MTLTVALTQTLAMPRYSKGLCTWGSQGAGLLFTPSGADARGGNAEQTAEIPGSEYGHLFRSSDAGAGGGNNEQTAESVKSHYLHCFPSEVSETPTITVVE